MSDLVERLRSSEAATIWSIVDEAADEIEKLRSQRGEAWSTVDRLNARNQALFEESLRLHEAVEELLLHRVGDLPRQGWLKDNDASRKSLARLAAIMENRG
ncbi:hypothetical protein [Microvirga lotononidis]|uniref:Uncharacterized protein n=1 Tax=Microvirga lotononidis TaxID=864069 RepID=I4YP38_9HYPH|nr:hypothetical protein [Microvirga lotononidis]EIM25730.1 hypothetical protein MicloDRAFT_00064570 [Microvirga lotononidis]WQO25662.1 hypothetical protein U0023_13140 [Microvirga lotononidis]